MRIKIFKVHTYKNITNVGNWNLEFILNKVHTPVVLDIIKYVLINCKMRFLYELNTITLHNINGPNPIKKSK